MEESSMRIPIGNFGNKLPDPVQHGSVSGEGTDAAARAAQGLGNTGMQVASDVMQVQARDAAIKQQEAEALARAKAGNALLDREIGIKTINADLEKRLMDGTLQHDKAEEAYTTAVQQLEPVSMDGADPVTTENMNKGLKRVEFSGLQSTQAMAERAKIVDYKNQADVALDKFGKLAGFPDADIEKINAQADSLDAIGSASYGKNWAAVKQNFKDRNWFNQASQRTMENRNNMDGLNRLEKELTDGFYTPKLDTDKRNMLLRGVMNDRLQLENRIEHDQAKAKSQATINLNKIDQQIASGIPITAEKWDEYSQQVKGSGLEVELVNRMKNEMEVQDMLRMPIEKQISFIQEKQAGVQQGGDMAEAANVERMRRVVEANVKQMQEDPLIFNQARTGVPVEPIAVESLLQPNGSETVKNIVTDRIASIRATQEKYGDQVKMRPFLGQESKMLVAMLDRMQPEQQGQLFSSLHKSFPDTESYLSAMRQIAPDSPIKARAGAMIAAGTKMNLVTSWRNSDPDLVGTAEGVANTLLTGENILNKTKSQKAEDGNTKTFPIPPEKEFREAFSTQVKSAYANNPEVYQSDMQAVRAYYVGKSAAEGDVSGVIDSPRMKEAVRSVVGEVVSVDDGDRGDVIAPWGMDESTFTDRLDTALVNKLTALNVPELIIDQRESLSFRNAGNGKYYVLAGKNYKVDSTGNPIVIDVIGGEQ